MEDTLHIHIEAFIKVRLRHLRRRLVLVACSCVVYDDVEAAELFFRRSHELGPGRSVGDRARDGGDVVRDVGRREVLGERVAVEIRRNDFAALGDEEVGCCEAEAGGGACQRRGLVSLGAGL
jgi:hypothetical protein